VAVLGLCLPVSDLLDGHDRLQVGDRCDAGPSDSVAGFPAGLEGLALPWPVARYDPAGLQSTRRVREPVREQRHHIDRRLHPGARARVNGSLRAEPLPIQIRVDAQRRYFVLLHVAVDPATGRAGLAVPGSLQGIVAAGHANWTDP